MFNQGLRLQLDPSNLKIIYFSNLILFLKSIFYQKKIFYLLKRCKNNFIITYYEKNTQLISYDAEENIDSDSMSFHSHNHNHNHKQSTYTQAISGLDPSTQIKG